MDLHPHLQGPAYLQIDAADKSALTKSVDILDTVGIYGVEISKRATTLVAACRGITELVEIASWYKVKTVHRQATNTLRRFQKAIQSLALDERRGMDIPAKQRTVSRTLRAVQSI